MTRENTGMRDAFVGKGIAWHRGMWGADRPDNGIGVITVWAVVTNGETEMPFDRETRRCTLHIRALPGEDWQYTRQGLELTDRCQRAQKANRPVEVIMRKGDRAKDYSDEVYTDPRYYAARITYVGSEATNDLGTIRGEFMTQAEYGA